MYVLSRHLGVDRRERRDVLVRLLQIVLREEQEEWNLMEHSVQIDRFKVIQLFSAD